MGEIDVKAFSSVSLPESKDLILADGMNTVHLIQGETGIGKTTLLKMVKAELPDHIPVYIDMTSIALGDLLFPFVNTDGSGVRFVPNEIFKLSEGKPLAIMWDEVGKTADRGALRQCRRTWLEKVIGNYPLPEGTIQFATTNLSAEGFGDLLLPHERNTLTILLVRKPTADEWTNNWAVDAGVHPTVLQAANTFPAMFESFTSYDDNAAGSNPYIFDPRLPQESFVTPRSLAAVSRKLWSSSHLSQSALTHAVVGTIGQRGGLDIMSLHELFGKIPTVKEVVKDPAKAMIPDSVAAICLFLYSAVQGATDDNIGKLLTYIKRLPGETGSLFVSTALRTNKRTLVTKNKDFMEWAKENNWLWNDPADGGK